MANDLGGLKTGAAAFLSHDAGYEESTCQSALPQSAELVNLRAAGLQGGKRFAHGWARPRDLVLRDGVVAKLFHPIFPPDRNAGDVIAALRQG